ncbi:reverse transcriptase domain-containing protein [Tanacetum coccineum]|uniref:Reverse transcriptase domain-containing protein n=1 Tax=Tanacetum coccineum TaxID=301880 RepID=A0ABQ4WHT1_9ASTR
MQTRSSSKFVGEPSTNPTSTNPKRRNRRCSKQRVEPFALEETPVVMMADQRTMAELLRAPTEGYAEAIVVPPIPAEHFELKHSLINLVTSKQFFGFEKEDPYAQYTIVYTDHSALKYLLAKQDAKPRLENPHQGDLENNEITETFPLETLGMISFRGDSSTPWFVDIANYHAGNFIVMLKYGVIHLLSTAYHPKTSGQVEVSNRGLKRILEMTVGENRASWFDKLDDALWAFHTAFKTPIECTPYKLVYGKACHLPIELEHKAYWALKHCNFDLKTAGDHRKVQMNELNELRDQAYENSLIYKEKTKKIHDSKIKNRVFNVGDRVLLFNSRLKIFSCKLKTRWTGPFTVAQVFPYGAVELSQTDGPNFKVNGHRLKHYFGGDIPLMVVSNLQTFPMDH